MVRRRDVRALPRRARRGERRQGRLHDGLRRAAPGALPEGRRHAPHGRPGRPIGIRDDSTWNVPEPEIGVVLGEHGRIAGLTIGNDVSSRDIEGANPLYLPQAKIYAGACAIGPAVYVPENLDAPLHIRMRVTDEWGRIVFEGETSTARMRRSFAELVELAARRQPRPAGQRPADRHGPRPARQLHAPARPLRRDPRPRDRHARRIPSCAPPS